LITDRQLQLNLQEMKQVKKEWPDRALTASLSDLRNHPSGIWFLFAVSFAYGVFHAVGPGHGKAVITSYMLASGDSARRGVALSFLSAAVQAVSAILVVAIGTIILRVSATAMTFATDWIEIASFAAITLFGAWLLVQKIRGDHRHHVAATQPVAGQFVCDDPSHDQLGAAHVNCCVPLPTPAGTPLAPPAPVDSFGDFLRRAWSAIVAVGIRPCSGAIIILVFALSQGLFLSGVAATFIMAAGTGLTVAAIALVAMSAKGLTLRVTGAGSSRGAAFLSRTIEIGGAAAVFLFGLVLLGGALAAGLPGT
ncbi:MAG: delayed-early response protein/equilibrative nucleoside transporter, partial [Rhizobiales bacterium]|nr:delayed-early response protein/equilibrative nucleoside transporter [Hyphomicrobiales bacterium]